MIRPRHKPIRREQTRAGSAARRRLEFNVVCDQVRRRKEQFIQRLATRLKQNGACLVFQGTLDHNGYPRMNFRYRGRHVTIHVNRVISILMNCGPIPAGFESAHDACCDSRACVRHVRLLPYSDNACTAWKRCTPPF